MNHHTYKDCPHNPAGAGGAPASRTCACIAILKMFVSSGGWWWNRFRRLAAGGGRVARVIDQGGAPGPTPQPQAAAAAAVRETLPPTLVPASPLLPPAQPPTSSNSLCVMADYDDDDYETECESDDYVDNFSAAEYTDQLLLLMGRGAGALDTTELSRCIYIVDVLCSRPGCCAPAEELQWCTLRAGLQRSHEIGCMAEEAAHTIEKYADKLHKQTEVIAKMQTTCYSQPSCDCCEQTYSYHHPLANYT